VYYANKHYLCAEVVFRGSAVRRTNRAKQPISVVFLGKKSTRKTTNILSSLSSEYEQNGQRKTTPQTLSKNVNISGNIPGMFLLLSKKRYKVTLHTGTQHSKLNTYHRRYRRPPLLLPRRSQCPWRARRRRRGAPRRTCRRPRPQRRG
jgi:hypothetical protein